MPDLLEHDGLQRFDGMVIPGGFGERGRRGKIAAAGYAREHDLPLLGLCLGLQVMIIDVARSLAELDGANSREFDAATPYPVIDLMDEQHDVVDKGGTMRLGSYEARLVPGSQVAKAYGTEHGLRAPPAPLRGQPPLPARARRGRPGAARASRPTGGWSSSSSSPATPSGWAPRPTRSSRAGPTAPIPLFRELVDAALDRAEGRDPACSTSMPIIDGRRRSPAATRPTRRLPRLPRSSARRSSTAGWVITLTRATFPDPDGTAFDRDVVRHPGAVAVVPVTDGDAVVLVRQYRPPVDRWLLEIPAGTCDVEDEPERRTARRELAEEVGYAAADWRCSPGVPSPPASATSTSAVYLATGLTPVRPTGRGSRSAT